MAARPRNWSGYEEAEELHQITMKWPKSLWREIQRLAFDEETSATALMIEAATKLLNERGRREQRKTDKKK